MSPTAQASTASRVAVPPLPLPARRQWLVERTSLLHTHARGLWVFRPRASLTPTGCSRCPSISPSHNALFHHVFSTVCGAGFTHLAWAMLVEGSLRAPGLQRAGCAPAPAPAPGIIRLPHPMKIALSRVSLARRRTLSREAHPGTVPVRPNHRPPDHKWRHRANPSTAIDRSQGP
jgi:hypothetical protein